MFEGNVEVDISMQQNQPTKLTAKLLLFLHFHNFYSSGHFCFDKQGSILKEQENKLNTFPVTFATKIGLYRNILLFV